MKRKLIILIIQVLLSGYVTGQDVTLPESNKNTTESHTFELRCFEIKKPSEIIGKWSFSSHWDGHMGIALELMEDGSFNYWFYSDLKSPDDPEYPIKGKWELQKGILNLKPQLDVRLYSKNWIMVQYGQSIGLLDPENIKVLIWHKATPDTRMLFKNETPFEWPMMNMPVVEATNK